MDLFSGLIHGFSVALTPMNLLFGFLGAVIGTIVGGFVMAVLNNGMSIMGVGSDIQQVVKGLVLLVAVAFDVMSKKKTR